MKTLTNNKSQMATLMTIEMTTPNDNPIDKLGWQPQKTAPAHDNAPVDNPDDNTN
jgi:hypothetical protein